MASTADTLRVEFDDGRIYTSVQDIRTRDVADSVRRAMRHAYRSGLAARPLTMGAEVMRL